MNSLCKIALFFSLAPIFAGFAQSKLEEDIPYKPNIIWIIVEDMSDNWSCYGEATIKTPNIDKLAGEGELFENAFVTSPICSPSRSGMVTGMYPTTIGAHNHRSQIKEGKGGGNRIYFDSYQLSGEIPFLPKLFKEAGYYTVLGSEQSIFNRQDKSDKLGKTDYNFVWDSFWYDSNDWGSRENGQPFFAQIQLNGGKFRSASVEKPVNPDEVEIPPYYPDDMVIRKDWAEYLNSVLYVDNEIKKIYDRLEAEGIADSTAVFLFTDHGISHLRGKQFLYEDGIKIPLIVKWPEVIKAGSRREDLVNQIDISATSLYLAGIPAPEMMQGRSFYGTNYQPADYIFAARDRADETFDIIRAVRNNRFKYIRNYLPHKAHAQPNTYKDGKEIISHMFQLHDEGKLKKVTTNYFKSMRPVEELYDLEKDPYEINNLAKNPSFQDTLRKMQDILVSQIVNTQDLGIIPEPILEELGRKYGNKFNVSFHPETKDLIRKCLEVIELDEQKDVDGLEKALSHKKAAVRFWAAYGLGNIPSLAESAIPAIKIALQDNSDAVKIAAARALCRLGYPEPSLRILADHLDNNNLIIGMYAALFIEDLDEDLIRQVMPEIEKAKNNPYEFTRRIAVRLSN